jgi:hypothetical protein
MDYQTTGQIRPVALAAVLSIAFWGCGGEAEQPREEQASEQAIRAAVILSPADGDTLAGPDVLVRLAAEGIELQPAGTDLPNTGHLHLYVNRDLTPEGQAIPSEDGIVHLGRAQTEHLLEGLAPGDYTVVAVIGDHLHVRIPGVATDTARIIVR